MKKDEAQAIHDDLPNRFMAALTTLDSAAMDGWHQGAWNSKEAGTRV